MNDEPVPFAQQPQSQLPQSPPPQPQSSGGPPPYDRVWAPSPFDPPADRQAPGALPPSVQPSGARAVGAQPADAQASSVLQPQHEPAQQPNSYAPGSWTAHDASSGTSLHTVPTAIFQPPSSGGYEPYRGTGARPMPVTKTRAVWSLVTGVVGLIISIFVGWGFPLSAAALVLGFGSRKRETAGRGLALAGIITGFAGLLFSVGWLVYSAVVFIGYFNS